MVTAVGVKTVDEVNAFGNLQVPLLPLGAEVSAFLANGEVLKMDIFRSCLVFTQTSIMSSCLKTRRKKSKGLSVRPLSAKLSLTDMTTAGWGSFWPQAENAKSSQARRNSRIREGCAVFFLEERISCASIFQMTFALRNINLIAVDLRCA